jgi:hypothetical protein
MAVPEERARETIDKKLAHSSWIVQSHDEVIVVAERTQGREDVSRTSCKTEYKSAPGPHPRGGWFVGG